MNPNLQNSKVIFLIFMMVAVLGYFILPLQEVQQKIPLIHGKTISELDAIVIPNEKTLISDREILSQKSAVVSVPPSYLVCSIDDDSEETNAYGIYDPTDLAVTVSNLIRLEVKHLFLGTHLHWPDLPPVENNTLNSQLEILDSCILSVPLRRTANEVVIPEYLLESSIRLSDVNGDVLMLPKVNNLSLGLTFKIPNNCKVGFSQIESEPETSRIPLLAVWGDRVILSSLVLERMHHLDLVIEDVDIFVGRYLSLGDTGNIIPIDEFGYFTPKGSPAAKGPDVISANITSIKESPVKTEHAILTAAGVKADYFRAIEAPVRQLTQLTLTPVYRDKVRYVRILWWVEVILAIVVAFLLAFIVRFSVFVYWVLAMMFGVWLVIGSVFLSKETHYYAPMVYLLLAIVVCMLVFPFLKRKANFIYELIGNQHDLGDLSSLYKQEQFAKRDLTVAKLSGRDRKRLRKERRRERRRIEKEKKSAVQPKKEDE